MVGQLERFKRGYMTGFKFATFVVCGLTLTGIQPVAAQTTTTSRSAAPRRPVPTSPILPRRPIRQQPLAGSLSPVPTGPLETLGQAIADAYRNNPQLQAQRAALRSVDEGLIQASSPYRLNASVVGQLAYVEQRQRNPFTDRFVTGDQKSMGVSLTVSQILSNGGRTASQVDAAEADVFAGREQLREAENQILFEVVDSYVSVRRDAEIVGIQERSVSSYQRQVEQAEARERGGDLTRTDIAQARAQLLIIQTQLAQARANFQARRARFTTVVGRAPLNLAPEPQLPGLPASIDAAYQIAERESPTLWQAIMNQRGASARIGAARAQRRPVISAEGSYGYNSLTSYATRDLGRGLSGQVTVSVPLLTGGVVASQVRAAIAVEQQAGFIVEATRRSVDQTLLNGWNQAVTSQNQVVIGQEAVTAAQDALTGVRSGFAEGFRSNFEVLDSEQRLLNAQIILANAQAAQYSAQASLLASLGRLQAAAIEQAVPVYDSVTPIERRYNRQFGPFQILLEPADKLLRPGKDSRPAPQLAPASDPTIVQATTPPPSGGLATSFPASPSGLPPVYTGPAPLPDQAPSRRSR